MNNKKINKKINNIIIFIITSWKGQEADALRSHPFRNGFARFQLPPNCNHEHRTGFQVPSGWPSSCPPFCAFLCAKNSWLESSWGKLMPGIRHWKPRQADGEADWENKFGLDPLR